LFFFEELHENDESGQPSGTYEEYSYCKLFSAIRNLTGLEADLEIQGIPHLRIKGVGEYKTRKM
jgi:hypothetical protein